MLKRNGLIWLWLPVILVAVDRLSKYWVTMHLNFFEPKVILPFFNLTLAYNTGAAFSFLHNASGWQNWVFAGLAAIVSVSILMYMAKLPAQERWTNIALSLILTGAIGNAWDRMLYGYVIDFLDFHINDWHFAIFNIADSAICVGAGMLILQWMRTKEKVKSK